MLNQVVLVGRIVRIEGKEENKKEIKVTLAVPRNYKNSEGIYETDFININIKGTMAENTIEYCKKGDLIGVKGRLESNRETNELQLMAERISYLSSAKTTEASEDEK